MIVTIRKELPGRRVTGIPGLCRRAAPPSHSGVKVQPAEGLAC